MTAGYRTAAISRMRRFRVSSQVLRQTRSPLGFMAPTCKEREQSLERLRIALGILGIPLLSQDTGHGCGDLTFDIPVAMPAVTRLRLSWDAGTGIMTLSILSTPSGSLAEPPTTLPPSRKTPCGTPPSPGLMTEAERQVYYREKQWQQSTKS